MLISNLLVGAGAATAATTASAIGPAAKNNLCTNQAVAATATTPTNAYTNAIFKQLFFKECKFEPFKIMFTYEDEDGLQMCEFRI